MNKKYITRKINGVKIKLPSIHIDSFYAQILFTLVYKYPLTEGTRVTLVLVPKKSLTDSDFFSPYCQGTACRISEKNYQITIPIGKNAEEKCLGWVLYCIAHEYKHCLQWNVERKNFGLGGKPDQKMEREARRFGTIESNRFRGLPDDPYGDIAFFDEIYSRNSSKN